MISSVRNFQNQRTFKMVIGVTSLDYCVKRHRFQVSPTQMKCMHPEAMKCGELLRMNLNSQGTQRMYGWMNKWINGWMDGQVGGCMNGWISGWMDELMNKWIDKWMDEWISGWMNWWISGWMDELMDKWVDGWMNDLWTMHNRECMQQLDKIATSNTNGQNTLTHKYKQIQDTISRKHK